MKTILSVYGTYDIGCKKPNNEDMILLNDEMFRDGSRQKEFDTEFEEVEKSFLKNDIYLLSSDGLHDLEASDVISDTLMLPDTRAAGAEKLLALVKENGGNDNISIITVKIEEKGK